MEAFSLKIGLLVHGNNGLGMSLSIEMVNMTHAGGAMLLRSLVFCCYGTFCLLTMGVIE